MSSWSRHSRRTVPTHLSAYALATGVRTGVRVIRVLIETPDVVEGATELRVPIADQVAGNDARLFHRGDDVAGVLGHPLPGRMRSDSGEPHPAGSDLDEEQHIETTQRDGVDAEEVTRHNACRLGPDEGPPRRGRAPRRGMDAMTSQDAADRTGRDSPAQTGEFPLDPLIAPSRVVRGEANDDCLDVVGY